MSTPLQFQELYLCPTQSNIVAGVMIGDVAIAPALKPIDPCTGKIIAASFAGQVRTTLENLDRFLETAGLNRGSVARATFFMQSLTERVSMNPVWEEWYPNPQDRPPYKYVPANLPEGTHVMLQIIAVRNAQRRGLQVDGLVHQDPMPLGVVMGNLITTSRIFAHRQVDDAAWHTQDVFANIEKVLDQVSASAADLQQVSVFIGDPAYHDTVAAQLTDILTGQGADPIVNILEVDLGVYALPRLEVIALLPE
jgi:enamine deaminase RidA (YjgF/YER057c/UK114 family)